MPAKKVDASVIATTDVEPLKVTRPALAGGLKLISEGANAREEATELFVEFEKITDMGAPKSALPRSMTSKLTYNCLKN